MSEELVIRRMCEGDLPGVLEIEKGTFSTPWTEATFHGLLRRPDADLFVAEADGQLVGYAAAWAVLDQGELGDIAVAPAYRGRGIGTSLLRRVFERQRQRGVREVYLEVRVSNLAAQRLYARYGFENVGRRRDYYSAPVEDAVVMRRRLDLLSDPLDFF